MRSSRFGSLAILAGAAALAAACGGGDATAPSTAESYPAPRWPSYFKPPKTVDDLMPAARRLVRNRSGFLGLGMGVLEEGESVLVVVTDIDANPMVLEAVKLALEERKITPHIKYLWELRGEDEKVVRAERDAQRSGRRIADAGIYQASDWIQGQFVRPDEPRKWLRERDPELYAELFPEEISGAWVEQTDDSGMSLDYAERGRTGEAIKKYLTDHPEIRGVFWGRGGGTGLRRQLYPMQDKFLGTFIQDNIFDLQSQMTSYPGDVWQLIEEQCLEPLVYTDRIEAVDPEGTNVWADLTEEMAQRWAAGAYQRGHLYMFPNQATGRFGYSFVDYPAFQPKYLPRWPIARLNGTIAGTAGHGGFFPHWEVIFEDGYIKDVKGGGAHGKALKAFLEYPPLVGKTYPFHEEPGYWYLYEIAFGSHPKTFRHPKPLRETGILSPERVRSGVIHWGLGIRVWHDESGPSESQIWNDFTEKNNIPKDHGFHTHTYFTTYRVRLRNGQKWVTLLDKGHMMSLDHPEVRALASRYGDPDYLLTEDWIPQIPGINVPGDYEKDYAQNAGEYSIGVVEKAIAGTYDHYFPPETVEVQKEASLAERDRVR